MSIIDRDEIRLAFNSKSAGFTEWQFSYESGYDYGWVVAYRVTKEEVFQKVAISYGLGFDNKTTNRKDALVLAMAMATAMEECWPRCDWPDLLKLARRAETKVAYGE